MDNLSLALPFIMHHPFALGTVSLCQKLANPRLFRQSLQQSAHQRLPLLRRRFCDLVKTRVWMPPAPDHHLFIHRFCFLHKGCFTHGALPFGLVSICPLFYLFFPRELFRDAPGIIVRPRFLVRLARGKAPAVARQTPPPTRAGLSFTHIFWWHGGRARERANAAVDTEKRGRPPRPHAPTQRDKS